MAEELDADIVDLCPHCDEPLREIASLCPHCEEGLARCGCGRIVGADFKLCPHCGAKMESEDMADKQEEEAKESAADMCPHCGVALAEIVSKCPDCGGMIVQCDCGRAIGPEFRICPYCNRENATLPTSAPPHDMVVAPQVSPPIVSPQAAVPAVVPPSSPCPYCNQAAPPDALVCPYCGGQMTQCVCGRKIGVDFRLCPFCSRVNPAFQGQAPQAPLPAVSNPVPPPAFSPHVAPLAYSPAPVVSVGATVPRLYFRQGRAYRAGQNALLEFKLQNSSPAPLDEIRLAISASCLAAPIEIECDSLPAYGESEFNPIQFTPDQVGDLLLQVKLKGRTRDESGVYLGRQIICVAPAEDKQVVIQAQRDIIGMDVDALLKSKPPEALSWQEIPLQIDNRERLKRLPPPLCEISAASRCRLAPRNGARVAGHFRIQMERGGKPADLHVFPGTQLVIGRGEGKCDLVVRRFPRNRRNDGLCARISGAHCLLRILPGEVTLEDLGSGNGTWVEKRRLQPRRRQSLADGETLRIAEALSFRVSVMTDGTKVTAAYLWRHSGARSRIGYVLLDSCAPLTFPGEVPRGTPPLLLRRGEDVFLTAEHGCQVGDEQIAPGLAPQLCDRDDVTCGDFSVRIYATVDCAYCNRPTQLKPDVYHCVHCGKTNLPQASIGD